MSVPEPEPEPEGVILFGYGSQVWLGFPIMIYIFWWSMHQLFLVSYTTHTPKRWRWGLVQWQVSSTKSNKLWVWIWKSMSPKKLGARLSTNHQSRYYYYYYYCRFGTHGFIFHLTRLREGGSLTRAHWWWSKINFSFQRLKGLAFA